MIPDVVKQDQLCYNKLSARTATVLRQVVIWESENNTFKGATLGHAFELTYSGREFQNDQEIISIHPSSHLFFCLQFSSVGLMHPSFRLD
jgi:hypothetical protein